MSDTPQTDEWSVDITCGVFGQTLLWKNSKGPFVSRRLAEKLERENAELQKENAALRKTLAEADLLYEYRRDDGRREWAVVETWIRRGDIIVQMDRDAFDAVRAKEAQS